MASSSTYPSIPVPQDNVDSLYQSFLLMRQTVQLLIVNSQQITNQTLTQASQIFSKKSDHADVSTTVNNSLVTVNKSIANINQAIGALQTQVAALQGIVSALQINVATLQGQMKTVIADIADLDNAVGDLDNRVSVLESKFPQHSAMRKITAPFSTSSTSYVMMGIGITAVPDDSQALVIMDGQLTNNTNGHYTTVVVCYGTGPPPNPGDPLTGTMLTQSSSFQASSGGGSNGPFSLAGIITGITINAPYWFDLAVLVTAGLGTVSNVDATAHVIA
jgi:hypothetical protein